MAKIMTKEDYISDLQSLLQFINSDPLKMQPHELAGLAHLYSMFMADKNFDLNLIDFSEHYLKCTEGLIPTPTPEVLKEKQQFFSEIKKHAEKIIQNILNGIEEEKQFGIKFIGPVFKQMKMINGELKYFYAIAYVAPRKKLSISYEKNKINVLLLNITNALGSDIIRIKRCKKEGCDTFFWQPTKRTKNYCSQKCAGAVRQKKYMNGISTK
jgi:hypothetical protein